MHALSFAKKLIVLLLLQAGLALAVPFTIAQDPAAPNVGPGTEDRQIVVNQLKIAAVTEYLKKILGTRYAQYAQLVTPDFAEKFVLSYKVGRSAANKLQIDGELDAKAMREWVNVADSKSRDGSTLKPVFLLTSKLPNNTVYAEDTAARSRDNALTQAMLALTNQSLQKLNVTAFPPRGALGSLSRPRTEYEIRALASQSGITGANSAIWIFLAPCPECGGARAEFYVYNLEQGRMIASESADIGIEPSNFANTERVKAAVADSFKEFQKSLESTISSGRAFTNTYQLAVEGLGSGDAQSYRVLRKLENALAHLDFVSQITPKLIESGRVQYEVLSKMKPTDLYQNLENSDFEGFSLKGVRVDSQTLTMRYSK